MKFLSTIVFLFLAFFSLGADYYGAPYEIKSQYHLDKIGKKFAKKNALKCLNSSLDSHLTGSEKCVWSLNFICRKDMTLEEARPIVKALTKTLFEAIHKDPVFQEHLTIAYEKNKKERYKAFTKESVGFRLAFWNKEIDRPMHPYLAQIRLADGKVYYHYADPKTQALLDPVVEDIDDNF